MKQIEDTLTALLTHGITPSLIVVGDKQQEELRNHFDANRLQFNLASDEGSFPCFTWNGCTVDIVVSEKEDFCMAYGNKTFA